MDKEFLNLKQFLPGLVSELEKRVPYASVLATTTSGVTIRIENREERVSHADPSQGVVFSAFNGEHFEEWAMGDTTPDALDNQARTFARSIQLKKERVKIEPGTRFEGHFATPVKTDPATMTLQEKFGYLKDLHRRLKTLDGRVVNGVVSYSETRGTKLFANRERLISQELCRIVIFLVLYVRDQGRTELGWEHRSGTGGFEIVRIEDDRLAGLKERTLKLLSAERITPGTYEVVADPDVAGILAHEAFGHGVELDMFLSGRAKAQNYLGCRIAAPFVSIVDDPSLPGGYGSYFFDDEGQESQPTHIIRNGVFERGLSDLHAASALKVSRTANGRRESFKKKVYARMSNTFFEKGQSSKDEMIESLNDGIYLCHAESGMEDPKDWGIQVIAHSGYEIKNGKPTGRVFSPIGITGYVPDMLMSISAVGNDFQLNGGTCGKGWKENIPVSTGGPHLKFRARLG